MLALNNARARVQVFPSSSFLGNVSYAWQPIVYPLDLADVGKSFISVLHLAVVTESLSIGADRLFFVNK